MVRFPYQDVIGGLTKAIEVNLYVIENAGTFFLLATQHIFVTFGPNKPDHHPKLRI
jgi:hypothetical protein